jgi:hypothetical protein
MKNVWVYDETEGVWRCETVEISLHRDSWWIKVNDDKRLGPFTSVAEAKSVAEVYLEETPLDG